MKKSFSSGCIFIAAVLWGCIGVFYKQLSALGFSPLQVVFVRVATAAVLMAVYLLVRNPSCFKIRLRDCWMFLGTGVVSLAFFNFCYFSAMDETSVSVAATLLYTAPIFVMLFSAVLFRETITAVKLVCVVFTFVGCMLVTGILGDDPITFRGLLFGLGAGVGYALYTVFGVYALRRYTTETVTFYTFVFAAVSVLPLCQPGALMLTFSASPLSATWHILCIGLLACLLPYLLYTKGLEGVSPGHASVMATLEPVVACVIGVLFLNDTLSALNIVGILLIVGAIVLLNIRLRKHNIE